MLDTEDYRMAPSGKGPQSGQWANKPHRLIYDLCNEINRMRVCLEMIREEAGDAMGRSGQHIGDLVQAAIGTEPDQ